MKHTLDTIYTYLEELNFSVEAMQWAASEELVWRRGEIEGSEDCQRARCFRSDV